MIETPYGFRVLGAAAGERRLTLHRAVYRAYCRGDPAAQPEITAFLSAFSFGEDFRQYLRATGSVRDYSGPVGVTGIHWDIDRAGDPAAALRDVRRLGAHLQDEFLREPHEILIGFSGDKGFHVEMPLEGIEPGPMTNRVCRRFAVGVADRLGIGIDEGTYDRTRLWRAWNSRHRRTGLHKVRIDSDDILHVSIDWILGRAREPIPFEPPAPSPCPEAEATWRRAEQAVLARAAERRAPRGRPANTRINALTEQLMRDPISVAVGDRHRRIFAAAANLAEFGTIDALIEALLTEPGLDTGLPPGEVSRQIVCGIRHVLERGGKEEHG